MAHLTHAVARRLPAPDKGNRLTYDDQVRGLAIRVTSTGSRSWVLNYRTRTGRERRYTIGEIESWRATAAREEARRLKRLIDEGGDPLQDIQDQRAAKTVAELIGRFEAEHLPDLRAATRRDYKLWLNKYVRPHFGPHVKVTEVQSQDIDALHRRITAAGHPYAANRVAQLVSSLFTLAVRWNMRESNPAKGVKRNREYHRRRYLDGEELARLLPALAAHDDQQAANVIRLMLLTGCRRGEALTARWQDIDLIKGVWSKTPASTKQRQHHQTPLAAPALQLLTEIQEQQKQAHPRKPPGTYVFPSNRNQKGEGPRLTINKDWRRLRKAAQLSDLRLHDLRHSHASFLASFGASLPLIGQLLGHSNPATTARYAHLHLDAQRQAVEQVGRLISEAARPADAPTAKVVPLKGEGAS